MALKLPIYQVDAFADQRFAGNPAAVVPLERWLPDELLQAIAAENNLSETAFVVPDGEDWAIRWFTPAIEVDLCGHATLAAGYVVHRHLEPGRTAIVFGSRSGRLGVEVEGEWLVLDFPAARAASHPTPAAVTEALGCEPAEYLVSDYEMAVFAEQRQVTAIAPDFRALAAISRVGMIVTAPGEDVDFVSRFFAPSAGIDEDPVTGSAHCILTPYWAARLGRSDLVARQLSRRGGLLRCRLDGQRVRIGGTVVPYLRGTIEV